MAFISSIPPPLFLWFSSPLSLSLSLSSFFPMWNPETHMLPFFTIFFLLFSRPCASQSSPPTRSSEDGGLNASSTTAFKVGVILDTAGAVGKMSRTCMEMAVSDFYSANPGHKTRLVLLTRDSSTDPVTAASAAVDLLKNEKVQAIIGPQTSDAADFVANLGSKVEVPVVSFSATSPSLSRAKSPYFVRAAVNDSSQANAIAALVSAFRWKQVVPIYEQSGAGAVPYLVDAIKEVGARVPYRCVLPLRATDDQISKELYKLTTMESRVFLVHVSRRLGSRLFTMAREAGMMSQGYAWIMAEGLTNLVGAMDPSVVHDSMHGVLGLRPYVPKTEKRREFTRRWRLQYIKQNPHDADIPELSVLGLWAYDTVCSMAMAAEQVGATDPGYNPAPGAAENTTDLAALEVSKTGRRLLGAILRTNFTGLSGRFHLEDGQLHAPAFEVVNVIGRGERVIGFWMLGHGLMRQLDLSSKRSYSASMADLGQVIWPGDATSVPKGWVQPMVGKKLKILVPGPVEPGFHSFLRAERDPDTNETVVGGYVIEVFEAAVRALPYAVVFEYITLQKNGKSAGTYNDLVQLVYQQKYDALVGDVTITHKRSEFVDFTLPYTASGVSMVVPYTDDRRKNAWIFLKPLTTNLWLISGAFFLFTGFVVWVLEHRINDDFRGPREHQLGTVFYFIFSTLVFSHKEKVVSNLARVVVIIWVFVVLILQSSYTASLTSMLTVKHLQPTVTDLRDLISTGDYVGYLNNSFTRGTLKNLGFDEKKLRSYRSPQEYQEALAKGSKGGGVAAVADEIPYLKVFLKDYCANYTMAGRPIKAGGFGFAFPRGSPLVPDLSRAILNITEGDKMVEIEKRWFGDQSNCPSKDSDLTSDSLNLASFWGLFLITGIASFASLLLFLFSFVYQHLHLLRDDGAGSSVWKRVQAVSRHFDHKDLSSYTFRKEAKDEAGKDHGDDPMATPYTHRTPTSATMASPFTDRSGHGYSTAYPLTSDSQTPFSIYNRTSGGTPPPESAEEITSAEIASPARDTPASSVEMTPTGG